MCEQREICVIIACNEFVRLLTRQWDIIISYAIDKILDSNNGVHSLFFVKQ